MNLLSNIKIFNNVGSTSVGVAATTFIDCRGYEGVMFILAGASSNIASTGSLIIQQASAASTGAGIYQSTFTYKYKCKKSYPMAVDVSKPLKPYVRLSMLTCTGVMCIPIAYGPHRAGSTEALVYVNSSNRPSAVWVATS